MDLVAGVAAVTGATTGDGGSAQPVLDGTAIRQYRHRLKELRAEIDELEARDDAVRAAQIRAERDWLVAALASASE